MRLKDYLDLTGMKLVRLAANCDLTVHQIYNIQKKGVPTLLSASKIANATYGWVSPQDLLPEQEIIKHLGDEYLEEMKQRWDKEIKEYKREKKT